MRTVLANYAAIENFVTKPPTKGFLTYEKFTDYLFIQSQLGGEALAGFFTLIVTCKNHNVNIFDYLPDILYRVANGHKVSNIDELLPWNWKQDKDRLKIDPDLDYVDIKCPPDLLIKRLGLEDKVYFAPERLKQDESVEQYNIIEQSA